MVGALVMPHNIFLHSELVQRRELSLAVNGAGAKREAVRYFSMESALSLAVTVLINLCVMAVFAAGFHDDAHIAASVGLSSAGRCAAMQPA